MNVSEKRITYADVVRRGALQVMSEAALRRISNNAEEMTVGEMLRLPINPRLLACAIMHEEIVSSRDMRLIAAALADIVFESAARQGIYVDFRTRGAIEVARQFARSECSLGELRVACVKAEAAQDSVMELANPLVDELAAIAVSVCDPDSRSAILRTLADALDLFHDTADVRHYIKVIETMLRGVA